MTFTFSQARRMSPEESSPYNNLISNAMKQYQQGINAKYAPQRQEAEIFNKRMTPLSQLAASPMFLAMHPDQQKQIAQMISQAMGGGQNNQNGDHKGEAGYPQGTSIRDMISNHFGGQGQRQDQIQEQQAQGEPSINMDMQGGQRQNNEIGLFPQAGQGIQGGAIASAEAPFRTSPVKPGSLYQNPNSGDVLSAPTHETTNTSQKIITGSKALEPIVSNLSSMSKPFLEKGGSLGLLASKAAGEAGKYGVSKHITDLLGGSKKANEYAEFQAEQVKAIERAYSSYDLPHNAETTKKLEHIFTPQTGEDYKGYKNRMKMELQSLAQRTQIAKNNLGGGFKINGEEVQPESTVSKYEQKITNQQDAERKRADRVTNAMRESQNNKVEIFDPDGKSWMISPNEVAAYRAHWKKESQHH